MLDSQYGQYEDYSVIITDNTSAPTADFTANKDREDNQISNIVQL